jgi:hypothetical protein
MTGERYGNLSRYPAGSLDHLGLNLLATAAKLIVGYWTGSLSLVNAPDPGPNSNTFSSEQMPTRPSAGRV